MTNPHHEQNRRSWNAVTPIHNAHKHDQAAFFRDGGSTLFPDELELAGGGFDGKRVLHLQCNCGQDSLSLVRHGAASVTGVDISDEAVEFARSLANDAGVQAEFERADVLEWLPRAASDGRRFDVVFSTYGTIGWLSDLNGWARGVAGVLEPGGSLVLLEFHPLVWVFDDRMKMIDDYFRNGPIEEADGVQDYVGRSGDGLTPSGRAGADAEPWSNPESSVSFQWTVAETVQAIVDAGLTIETLREYPYSNGCRIWSTMSELPGRRYGSPDRALPLMVGLRARRL